MLCDHTAKVVLATGALYPWLSAESNATLYLIFTIIGRFAFPVFAWFVAEGCRKTSAPRRYLLRLFLFAILSEVPFQFCFYGAAYDGVQLGFHNVLFTFLLAALGIFSCEYLRRGHELGIISIVSLLLVLFLGRYLRTDYNLWGVLLVTMLYYLPSNRYRVVAVLLWSAAFYLIHHGIVGSTVLWIQPGNQLQLYYFFGAALSAVFLGCYNGKQGRPTKWLFYVFYPAHLAGLYLLSLLFAFRLR